MRQIIRTALVVLSLSPLAMAQPSPIYYNPGIILDTAPPTVDAVVFDNSGIFEPLPTGAVSNLTSSAEVIATPLPFMTRDTLYFTNTGTMAWGPGFQFDTGTATGRFSALDVFNSGTIIAEDTPAEAVSFATTGSMATTPLPQDSQGIPSQLLIYSTNVVNEGELGVGNAGVLQIVARTFTNANGSMAAGGINTGGSTSLVLTEEGIEGSTDPLDATGRGDTEPVTGYYVNPPSVYDLLWGVTNGGMLHVGPACGTAAGGDSDQHDVPRGGRSDRLESH